MATQPDSISALPSEIDFSADPDASPDRMNRAMKYLLGQVRVAQAQVKSYQAVIDELRALGLERVADALTPVFQQAQATGDAIQAIYDNLASNGALDDYYTREQADALLADKADAAATTEALASKADAAATTAALAQKVSLTGPETVVDKTLMNAKEAYYAIEDAAGFAVDPANGTPQQVTLAANRTPDFSAIAEGEYVELWVDDGAGYTLDLSAVDIWDTDGGTAVVLKSTGFTRILFEKVNGVLHAGRLGDGG